MSARVLGRSSVRRSLIGLALTAVVGTYAAFVGSADAAELPISQGKPVTASSAENGGSAAANAVDGNGGTRWSSAFSDPQWLQVDLGATATITQVVLNWEAAYATRFQSRPRPTAPPGRPINTTTNGTGGTQTLNVSGSGRYVRLNTTRRATQYGVSLWEFQVFGTGGATPPATRPPSRRARSGSRSSSPTARSATGCRTTRSSSPACRAPRTCTASSAAPSPTPTARSTTWPTAPSNCNPAVDKSSYWVPTLYSDGVAWSR